MMRTLALRSRPRGRPSPKTFSRRGRKCAGRLALRAEKDMDSPFGLKVNPPESRDDLGKALPLPKKACNDSDFGGVSGTAKYPDIPPLPGTGPPSSAGF